MGSSIKRASQRKLFLLPIVYWMLKVLTSLANELMFDVMANYNDLLTDDPFLKRWVTDYAIIFVNTYSQIFNSVSMLDDSTLFSFGKFSRKNYR